MTNYLILMSIYDTLYSAFYDGVNSPEWEIESPYLGDFGAKIQGSRRTKDITVYYNNDDIVYQRDYNGNWIQYLNLNNIMKFLNNECSWTYLDYKQSTHYGGSQFLVRVDSPTSLAGIYVVKGPYDGRQVFTRLCDIPSTPCFGKLSVGGGGGSSVCMAVIYNNATLTATAYGTADNWSTQTTPLSLGSLYWSSKGHELIPGYGYSANIAWEVGAITSSLSRTVGQELTFSFYDFSLTSSTITKNQRDCFITAPMTGYYNIDFQDSWIDPQNMYNRCLRAYKGVASYPTPLFTTVKYKQTVGSRYEYEFASYEDTSNIITVLGGDYLGETIVFGLHADSPFPRDSLYKIDGTDISDKLLPIASFDESVRSIYVLKDLDGYRNASVVLNGVDTAEISAYGYYGATPALTDRAAWDLVYGYKEYHANDIDYDEDSIHHTIGTTDYQVAAGSHDHGYYKNFLIGG